MKAKRGELLLTAVLTLIIGWKLGAYQEQQNLIHRFAIPKDIVMGTGSVITDPEREADMSIVWSAWRTLLSSYIAPQDLDAHKLEMGAAEGLVRAVGDPYTVFMPPKQAQAFRESLDGSLEGIGAELKEKDDYAQVIAPIKGSPAEAAGLKKDDFITEVDHVSISGWSLDQIVSKIRGPKGTKVVLTVLRTGELKPLDLSIVRDTIHIPSVASSITKTQSGSVGVIVLTQFGEESLQEVRDALHTIMETPVKGIVIDLRGNGGGYLDSAVSLTSLFLNSGKVVSVEKRGEKPEERFVSGSPEQPTIPLVILIDEGSASASEILAAALQDNHRAVIVGMKSYGKGSVQEIHDLPGGATLKVTAARWITPGGKNLGKEGVHPDIIQDITPADVQAKKDPQLDVGIHAIFDTKWSKGTVVKVHAK